MPLPLPSVKNAPNSFSIRRYEIGLPRLRRRWNCLSLPATAKPAARSAIKVLHAKLMDNPAVHQRLAQEFPQAATQLGTPQHRPRASKMGIDGSTSYLVYELVEGANLGDRITGRKRLPEGEAVRIITQRASAALRTPPPSDSPRCEARQHSCAARRPREAHRLRAGKGLQQRPGPTRHASGLGTPNFTAPGAIRRCEKRRGTLDVYSLAVTPLRRSDRHPSARRENAVRDSGKEGARNSPRRALVPDLSERVDAAILVPRCTRTHKSDLGRVWSSSNSSRRARTSMTAMPMICPRASRFRS